MAQQQTNIVYGPEAGAAGITKHQQSQGCCSPLRLSSMIPGSLIFISGGMSMIQGMGWTDLSVSGDLGHFHYSWFIAVIIGTVLSLPLGHILPRKFQMAAALLILAGGLIFVIEPYNLDALVAGRYLNGIGVGLTTLPFLCHTSEIARTTSRGACLGLEQFCLSLGIAIQMISLSQWSVTSTFPTNRFHGILDILLAVVAIIALFYFIESPVYYLRKGDETGALNSLARLQRPPGITTETTELLKQHKDYVHEQQNFSMMECLKRGFFPMVKMLFFRSVILAFSCSLQLNVALEVSMIVTKTPWSPVVAGSVRVLGSCLTLLMVDKFGRKLPSTLWSIFIGGLLVLIAIIFNLNVMNMDTMAMVTIICWLMQLFAGLYSPNTSVYLGEAFPLKLKTFFMGLCVIVEQILHLVVILCASPLGNDGSFMAEGIMIIAVSCVCISLTMPETKKTTLKEAQKRFARFFNLKMC